MRTGGRLGEQDRVRQGEAEAVASRLAVRVMLHALIAMIKSMAGRVGGYDEAGCEWLGLGWGNGRRVCRARAAFACHASGLLEQMVQGLARLARLAWPEPKPD